MQYVGFLKRLEKSVSGEVRILSRIAASDVRSVTGKNCLNLGIEFGLDPWKETPGSIRKKYKVYDLPNQDNWRLPLLASLLRERHELDVTGENIENISGLIESL